MATIADIEGVSDAVRHDLVRGVDILKAGGCEEVYLFGSIADGSCTSRSDIDFAVKGCPADMFYKLQGRLLMELARSVDLIDLDADAELATFLERQAELIRVD
ncbi:MAG: nucleotidyltransferase domain-containing protein [Gemmatimonadota bacterium]|nr:nucleotidyltransferase domain-containing protein [Gemmatimonadota bacterium]